jgi:ribosomal protein S18 acetylase RimI-like enzyme
MQGRCLPVADLAIRPMTPADLPAANDMALAQGWRDRRRFFEFVWRVATSQPLVGIADGRLVATGVATANGSVGWIGAIVVAEAFRGRGFGRAMTEELIRRLRIAGCETISLEATDAGKPMYERLGFRVVTRYHQLEAAYLPEPPTPPEGALVRSLERADLPFIFALDRTASGEDRSAPLAALAESGGGWAITDEDTALRGFLLPAERAYGAIVAPRFEDGLFLLDLHRHVVGDGGHVRAGIPGEHEAAVRELEGRGWRETWRAPRLLLGPDVPWRPTWIWGQINSAMG